jgi:hypothetical protein
MRGSYSRPVWLLLLPLLLPLQDTLAWHGTNRSLQPA